MNSWKEPALSIALGLGAFVVALMLSALTLLIVNIVWAFSTVIAVLLLVSLTIGGGLLLRYLRFLVGRRLS